MLVSQLLRNEISILSSNPTQYTPEPGDEPLPLELEVRIDAISARFSTSLRGSNPVSIEECLTEAEPGWRVRLLQELLIEELEYRSEKCHQLRLKDYVARFPNFVAQVEFAFRSIPTFIADRYQEVATVGIGGMGEVLIATDYELNRKVAVKKMRSHAAADAGARARFLREAHVTSKLEHPGIVPVYSLGNSVDGRPYYAMRYIHGRSLQDVIESCEAKRREPSFLRSHEFRSLLNHFVNVCQTVCYAHSQRIVHRDIKPANIMVGSYGETLLVDWGLSKVLSQAAVDDRPGGNPSTNSIEGWVPMDDPMSANNPLSLDGHVIGTPAYMSPEQRQGIQEDVGFPSDIYSLGATLYCILTGHPPVDLKLPTGEINSPPALSFPDGIPRALQAICAKSMAQPMDARYPSPLEIANDVQAWLLDQPVSVWNDSLSVRLRRWMVLHPKTMASIAAATVVGLMAISGLAYLSERHARAVQRDAQTIQEKSMALQEKSRALEEEKQGLEFVLHVLEESGLNKDSQGQSETLRGFLERAEQALTENQTLGNSQRAGVLFRLGATWWGLSDYEAARRQWRQMCELDAQNENVSDIDRIQARGTLALAEMQCGDLPKAIELATAALQDMQKIEAEDSPETLHLMHVLAGIHVKAGNLPEGIALNRKVLELRQKESSQPTLPIVMSQANLGRSIHDSGNFEEAIKFYEASLLGRRFLESKGQFPKGSFFGEFNLGVAHFDRGDVKSALPHLRNALGDFESFLAPNHPDVLSCRMALARCNLELGDRAAIDEMERILALSEQRTSKLSWPTCQIRSTLIISALEHGNRERAQELAEEAMKLAPSVDAPMIAASMSLAPTIVAIQCDDVTRASSFSKLCLDRFSRLNSNSWQKGLAQSLYGQALLKSNDTDRAIAYLEEGHAEMLRHKAEIFFGDRKRLEEATKALTTCRELMAVPTGSGSVLAK